MQDMGIISYLAQHFHHTHTGAVPDPYHNRTSVIPDPYHNSHIHICMVQNSYHNNHIYIDVLLDHITTHQ